MFRFILISFLACLGVSACQGNQAVFEPSEVPDSDYREPTSGM